MYLCQSHVTSHICVGSISADALHVQVRKALRSYRSGGEGPLGLIDSVVEVLRLPGRQHLLAGFTQMLSKPQRAWFRQCLKSAFLPF